MFATSGSFDVQLYHHSLINKTINKTHTLRRHTAQVTSVDITYDGLLGVTAGQDRMIYLWDFIKANVIREVNLSSFIVRVNLTPMGKFVAMTTLEGAVSLYETLTGITWRTERIDGKHSGVAIANTNYIMECCKEGVEHRMAQFIDKERERLVRDFHDVRGFSESTFGPSQSSPSKSQSQASP